MKECEWSTSKMQYDPEFVFNFKPANGGSYHQFPGLVYRATGWLKSEDKTESECAGLCDAGVLAKPPPQGTGTRNVCAIAARK